MSSLHRKQLENKCYVPERSFMHLTVSNKFWVGGEGGGSSAVMLLNRTSAVMLFNRTAGRINHRCINSYTLFPSLTVVHLSASPFPSHYYIFFFTWPLSSAFSTFFWRSSCATGLYSAWAMLALKRSRRSRSWDERHRREVNGRVLKAWNCEDYICWWVTTVRTVSSIYLQFKL